MEPIESIIFDWGGVLIEDPRPGLLKFCAEALGVSQEDYAPVHDTFLGEFHTGAISEHTFWRQIGRMIGKPVPEVSSLWYEAFKSAYVPRPEVFSLVSSLHERGYKTALLSNTELPAAKFFQEQKYEMFDVLVFSCAEGVMKPQRKIYEITLERLGSDAQRTIFTDDREDFIAGAKQAGLHTILFENIDQLKSELARLGVE
ncbi:MAG: HAD family hydrolase [Planctomycetota bacterium]|jgi:epoxide hydrolase-like predicted phosphatase